MGHVPSRTRRAVEQRAEGRCEYCHAPQVILGYRLHVDHSVPRARGGVNDLDNLALSCGTCNFAKGALVEARDPASGAPAPPFNPRVHAWADHFAWARDGATLVGKTAVGRATVAALNMNQPLQVAATRSGANSASSREGTAVLVHGGGRRASVAGPSSLARRAPLCYHRSP